MVSGKREFGRAARPKVTRSVALLFALLGVAALFIITPVGAVTLNQTGTPLNYFYHRTHNVTVTIGGVSGLSNFYVNVTVPTGWTITGRSAGSVLAETRVITWYFASPTGSELIYYTMTPDTSVAELTKSTMASSYNHSTQGPPVAGQNLTFIRIGDTRVIDILEELGRGNGNYPYSTRYGGTIYIPASTTTQIYFLTRIYNIAQYLANTTETAKSVTMYCEYPASQPTVTYHLVNTLAKSTNVWQANYSISEIEPSWWRMGYVGIDISNLAVGTNLTVNCTNLRYNFAHGSINVTNQTFTLSAATVTPITVTASASNVSINQGQTENEIIYNISNSGPYDIDEPQFEIQAPANSLFIGTRGELWGTAMKKYTISLPRLQSQQSFNTTLVARFDVTTDGSITLGTITSRFVPPWETTAYNPAELIQTTTLATAISVTTETGAAITTVRGEIANLRGVVNNINDTSNQIRTIVTHVNSTVNSMNLTANTINATLHQLNESMRMTIIPMLNGINGNVTAVNTTVNAVRALVDCSNSTWAGVCNKLNNVTANLDNVNSTVVRINNTVNDIASWQSGEQFRRFNNMDGNLSIVNTTLNGVRNLVDCSNSTWAGVCNKLDNVTSIVDLINATSKQTFVIAQNISTTVQFINNTRWSNFTAADIFNKIQQSIALSTQDTENIQDRIRNLKELTQEAVFLVTDSVGLQAQAKEDIARGDLSGAMTKLEKASSNLDQANAMVEAYMNAKVATVGEGGTGMTGNAGLGVQGLGSAGLAMAVLLAGIVAGYAAPRLAGSLRLGERISAFTLSAGKKTGSRRGRRHSPRKSSSSKGRPARRRSARKARK